MELVAKNYKQTEVGLIPNDWEVKTIAEVVEVDPDNLGSSTNPEYEFNYISLEDVDYGTLRNISEIVFKNAPSRARRKVKKNDILISTVRPNLKSHLLITNDVFDWVCSTGFSVLRCKSETNSAFLFNHFFASIINRQIENLITGSNYPAINSKEVKALQIPIPPTKAEQTLIATALSDADALISSLQKLIAKKRNIKQGAMQKLLNPDSYDLDDDLDLTEEEKSQKSINHKNHSSDKWEVKKLGEIVKITSGESPIKFEFKETGVPYFKVEQLNNGSIYAEQTEYYIQFGNPIAAGSIIFPKRGASIFLNKIRILRTHSYMDTNLMTLTPINGISNIFLFYSLIYKGLDQIADTTSIPQINNKHILPFEILVPPLSEQTRIATILSDMDAEITALETKLEKYKKVKLGMMQELLTGKIRLK